MVSKATTSCSPLRKEWRIGSKVSELCTSLPGKSHSFKADERTRVFVVFEVMSWIALAFDWKSHFLLKILLCWSDWMSSMGERRHNVKKATVTFEERSLIKGWSGLKSIYWKSQAFQFQSRFSLIASCFAFDILIGFSLKRFCRKWGLISHFPCAAA